MIISDNQLTTENPYIIVLLPKTTEVRNQRFKSKRTTDILCNSNLLDLKILPICMLPTIKRFKIGVIILLFIAFLPSRFTVSLSQDYKRFLIAAEQAANWLTSIENPENTCNGLSWPESDISSTKYTGLDQGASGIGLFFLKLYEETSDQNYLSKAKKAANYIYDRYSKGDMFGPDWLAGAASGGNYFLELYKVTKEVDFLDKAKFTAEWLINNVSIEGDGYHWPHYPNFPKLYTGIAHGAAGIGLFFLDLFSQTMNATYLRYAEGAFSWIKNYTVKFDENSIGWKRLTTDNDVYHLWCGGSTGIIFFLDSLYRVTNKQIYLDFLSKTANGLIKYAMNHNGGYAWSYGTQDNTLTIIYCHGTSSVVHALYTAYSTLKDEKYLNYCRGGATWLKNAKRTLYSDLYFWPYFYTWDQFESGLLTGTASVGYSFLKYYKYDKQPDYITYAKAAADYLLNISDQPTSTQRRWINYTNREDPNYDKHTYYSGWYNGAAGIGIFLLELYQTLKAIEKQDTTTDITPINYVLLKNYPNPFNSSTKILFNIPFDSEINIDIYNALGRKVRTLIKNQFYKTGEQSIFWDATNDFNNFVSTGVYICRLYTKEGFISNKMIFIK
jgi:lantibiotic modifying enzyme